MQSFGYDYPFVNIFIPMIFLAVAIVVSGLFIMIPSLKRRGKQILMQSIDAAVILFIFSAIILGSSGVLSLLVPAGDAYAYVLFLLEMRRQIFLSQIAIVLGVWVVVIVALSLFGPLRTGVQALMLPALQMSVVAAVGLIMGIQLLQLFVELWAYAIFPFFMTIGIVAMTLTPLGSHKWGLWLITTSLIMYILIPVAIYYSYGFVAYVNVGFWGNLIWVVPVNIALYVMAAVAVPTMVIYILFGFAQIVASSIVGQDFNLPLFGWAGSILSGGGGGLAK